MKFSMFTAGAIAASLAFVLFILDISNGIMSKSANWLSTEVAVASGSLLLLGVLLMGSQIKKSSDEPTVRKRRRSSRS